MAFKYPLDVFASQNKKQTYSIESHMTLGKSDDGQSPLKIFHDKFAFFKHSIIEKDSAVKAVYANINVKEMEDVFRRTHYAFFKSMDFECAPVGDISDEDANSPAYTVKMTTGPYKGYTPAEVLIANPDDPEVIKNLNNQYKFLKDNIKKYPRNKAQMDAIAEAAKLQKEGKLAKAAAAKAPSIKLYPAGASTPKPLRRKVRDDGKSFIYEIEIYWHVGDKYPIEVSIKNYWAPVKTMDDGTIRVVQKESADAISRSMRLSEVDWLNAVRSMRYDMANFSLLNAKTARTDSANVLRQNIESAK